MIEGLPWYVVMTIVAVNATFLTFWIVNLPDALRRTGCQHPGRTVAAIAAILLAWMALQATLALRGVYLKDAATTPRFLFGITPPLVAAVLLFSWTRSRHVLDRIPLTSLTYVHTVRFFVELVVYALFVYGRVPRLMTFLGRNPDILIGLTAPLVGYVCFTRDIASRKIGLAWHLIGLALLANVAIQFVLSVPSPFQLFDAQPPNVGFFYFPFIWAPTHGVPTVILVQSIAVRQLLMSGRRP
jgi:hypothetical protein